MSPDRSSLVAEWWPLIYRRARTLYRYALAESPAELAQEIALRVLRKLPLFDPARGPFPAFVRVVARSTAWQLRHKALTRRRLVRLVAPADADGDSLDRAADPRSPDPAEVAAHRLDLAEVLAPVLAAVGRLPARWRSDLRKRFGLNGEREHLLAEIDPGCGANATGQRVAAAIGLVRRRLVG